MKETDKDSKSKDKQSEDGAKPELTQRELEQRRKKYLASIKPAKQPYGGRKGGWGRFR